MATIARNQSLASTPTSFAIDLVFILSFDSSFHHSRLTSITPFHSQHTF